MSRPWGTKPIRPINPKKRVYCSECKWYKEELTNIPGMFKIFVHHRCLHPNNKHEVWSSGDAIKRPELICVKATVANTKNKYNNCQDFEWIDDEVQTKKACMYDCYD